MVINDDNFDEISEARANEQERLMRDEGFAAKDAWRAATRTVASQVGMDARAFAVAMKEIAMKRLSEEPSITWEAIKTPRNQADLARRQWWRTHPAEFEGVLRVLFEHDPIGICIGDGGPSEYSLEVNTMLPQLLIAESELRVQAVVNQELVRWFGDTAERASSRFPAVSAAIWQFLQASGRRGFDPVAAS